MATPKGQIATWRIYPESRNGAFYTVRVFRTLGAMRRYATRIGHDSFARCAGAAICYRRELYTRGRFTCVSHEWGEILLAVRRLTTRIIAHECSHAVVAWMQRQGFTLDLSDTGNASPGEERFAYAQGDLVSQLVAGCYHHQLLTPGTQ